MKTRVNITGLTFAVLTAFLVYGCASQPPQYESADNARMSYQQVSQNDQIKQYAPVKLYEAEQEVQKMDNAIDKKADKDEIDHLAYLVQQRVEIAKTAAQRNQASDQIAQLNKELTTARAQSEKEKAEQAAMEAQQKATSLEQELAKLKTSSIHEEPRGIVLTLGDVYFDFNKATLKPGAAQDLNEMAQFMKDNPQHNIIVEGYADSTGPASYNRQLSVERADAIINYLVRQGVNRDRLSAQGYGESFPVATNETPAGRQLNRRAEFVVLRNGQQPETAMREQPEGGGEFASFSELDKDHNGYLSKDETQDVKNLNKDFSQFDANDDNQLSRSEFSAFEEMEIQQQGQQ
jgi:outer membrane protein OmpA-like peptidoglycan-associated protein